ncbi:hypothetical protein L1887_27117 [Cichorium endivia]|nr:hypothetical protein L1887_27117 [Cichorium endivia]
MAHLTVCSREQEQLIFDAITHNRTSCLTSLLLSAVNSLAYESDPRLRDPVYGCVGLISILQHRLRQVQIDSENAKRELANYIRPSAMLPLLNQGFIQQSVLPYKMQPEPVFGLTGVSSFREVQHHQQNIVQDQQLIGATGEREQPEVLRNYTDGRQVIIWDLPVGLMRFQLLDRFNTSHRTKYTTTSTGNCFSTDNRCHCKEPSSREEDFNMEMESIPNSNINLSYSTGSSLVYFVRWLDGDGGGGGGRWRFFKNTNINMNRWCSSYP